MALIEVYKGLCLEPTQVVAIRHHAEGYSRGHISIHTDHQKIMIEGDREAFEAIQVALNDSLALLYSEAVEPGDLSLEEFQAILDSNPEVLDNFSWPGVIETKEDEELQ